MTYSQVPLYLTRFEEETDPPDWAVSALTDPAAEVAALGLRVETLVVAPLSAGWTTSLPPTWYRSGAGPLQALSDAAGALGRGALDAVLIRGAEPLRTGYRREERHRLMDIYGGTTIPEAYDALAKAFCERLGWSGADFRAIAQALYENYLATANACGSLPNCSTDEKWLCDLTQLQRGVDCANPLIDWRGQVLLLTAQALKRLAPAEGEVARLAGAGFAKLEVDGPAHVARIAKFDHLESAITQAEREAGLSIKNLPAAMEVYSCYPVIPAAFLVASGIAANPREICEYLARHPITVTGGMNLARAPWNLPALRALVRVGKMVAKGQAPLGVVHGNGGIGYAQGVAILKNS